MTVTVTSNKKNTSAVLHFNANATVIVAGNSSQSNVAMSDEVLTGATIVQSFWGVDGTGSIQVKRDTTLIAVYDSTGFKDYAGSGMPLNVVPTGNINVTFIGTSNAYLMLEVQKQGTFNTSPYNIT